MLLQLKGLGIRNLIDFDYFGSKPARESFEQSLDLLYHLGAVDMQGELTLEKGAALVELASLVDARNASACLLANGDDFKVCNELIIIACLM